MNKQLKIAVRGGHNFLATGASGLIDETTEDRKVKDAVIICLKKLGHEVLDVTPGKMSKKEDLNYGVSRANAWGADLFISVHFNNAYESYQGKIGTECCIFSEGGNAELVGERVCKELGALGFKNRGNKNRPELYELKYTSMPAVIVEVCFVEATEDVKLYQRLGYDKVGKTIAQAIANKEVGLDPDNPVGDKKLFYRVVTGSYSNKSNAIKRKKELELAGFESFLDPFYK